MACQVSILGPRGYEPRTLPLRHMPTDITISKIFIYLNKIYQEYFEHLVYRTYGTEYFYGSLYQTILQQYEFFAIDLRSSLDSRTTAVCCCLLELWRYTGYRLEKSNLWYDTTPTSSLYLLLFLFWGHNTLGTTVLRSDVPQDHRYKILRSSMYGLREKSRCLRVVYENDVTNVVYFQPGITCTTQQYPTVFVYPADVTDFQPGGG